MGTTLPRQFPRLGEKLLERGLIQEEHLVEALRAQRFCSLPLGEILCEMGVLWPEDVEEVLEGEEYWRKESV